MDGWEEYGDPNSPSTIPPSIDDPENPGVYADDRPLTDETIDRADIGDVRNRLGAFIQSMRDGRVPGDNSAALPLLLQQFSQLKDQNVGKEPFVKGLFSLVAAKGCQRGAKAAAGTDRGAKGKLLKKARAMGIGKCIAEALKKIGPKLKGIIGKMNKGALKLLQAQATKK